MALYHQHRPKAFSEVLGQDYIKTTLQNQLKNNRVGHAYLFSGPRGVGKTTTARILSKTVNCLQLKDSVACNSCNNCNLIDQNKTVDILEIDAASHTGVENVRTNIIENAQFKPSTLNKKVFIIDEVHMLSTSAFNALLKIMEEPPAHVLFILATTELHKVPETIISRCQRFQFDRIPVDTLVKHIQFLAKSEKVKIDDASAARIAALSQGCARDAVSLFEQVSVASDGNITSEDLSLILPNSSLQTVLQYISGIANQDVALAYQATKNLSSTNTDPFFFANQCIQSLRDVLLLHMKQFSDVQKHMYSDEEFELLEDISKQTNANQIIGLIDKLTSRKQMIKRSPIQTLPLEMIIMEFTNQNNTPIKSTQPTTPITPPTPVKPVVTKSTTPTPTPAAPINITPDRTPEQPKPKEVKKEVKAESKTINNSSISPEAIWPKFIELVENEKPSLVFILKMGKLIGLQDNIFTLEVPYSFHQDKLTNTETKLFLETHLSTLLENNTSLLVTVKGTESTNHDSELDDLADLVGGAVVA